MGKNMTIGLEGCLVVIAIASATTATAALAFGASSKGVNRASDIQPKLGYCWYNGK